MGGIFTGRNVLFVVDPEASPDEVELSTWSDEGSQTWAGYRMHGDRGTTGRPVHVTAERVDVSFEKSGTLHGSAETTIKVTRDGLRVVRLNLYPTLRVSGVFSDNGEPLDYVQEDKHDDPRFRDCPAHPGEGRYHASPAYPLRGPRRPHPRRRWHVLPCRRRA